MSIDWNIETSGARQIHLSVRGTHYSAQIKALIPMKDVINASVEEEKTCNPLFNPTNDRVFINGNGWLFEYVLGYLCSDPKARTLILPANFTEHAQLREEARRYGLDELMRLVDQDLGNFQGSVAVTRGGGGDDQNQAPTKTMSTYTSRDLRFKYRRRGLGGTAYTESGARSAYEGVYVDNPTTVPRTRKVEHIVQTALKHRLVLVRSGFMTGKTAMGQLIEKYLLDNFDTGVYDEHAREIKKIEPILFSANWPALTGDKRKLTFGQYWKKHTHFDFQDLIDEQEQTVIVILDEAQRLWNSDWVIVDEFWPAFKLTMGKKLCLIALTPCGYGGLTVGCSSPMDFNYKFAYNNFMKYTDDEYNHYFYHTFGSYFNINNDNPDSIAFKNYLSARTNNHPGLLAGTFNFLRTNAKDPTPNALSKWLVNGYYYLDMGTDRCGLGNATIPPKVEKLFKRMVTIIDDYVSSSEVDKLKECLFKLKPHFLKDTYDIVVKGSLCITMQIIGRDVLRFSSPLIRDICQYKYLFSCLRRANHNPSNLEQLFIYALMGLDINILSTTQSRTVATNLAHEGEWHFAMLQAFHNVTRKQVTISNNCNQDISGQIDVLLLDIEDMDNFYYGVEFLRQNDHFYEHLNRFALNPTDPSRQRTERQGEYCSIYDQTKQCAIVNVLGSSAQTKRIIQDNVAMCKAANLDKLVLVNIVFDQDTRTNKIPQESVKLYFNGDQNDLNFPKSEN